MNCSRCVATGVLLSASPIRRLSLHRELNSRTLLYRIPLAQNYRRLRLQRASEHRVCRADWQRLIFLTHTALIFGTMMIAFLLDAMPVNATFWSALLNV